MMPRIITLILAVIFTTDNINITANDSIPSIDLLYSYTDINSVSAKGTRYKGQLVKKKRAGMGVLKLKNGDIYIGDFYDNNMHGTGMYISRSTIESCPGACVYVGKWKNNSKNGNGICYDAFGSVIYSGKFDNNIPLSGFPSEKDSTNAEKQFLTLALPNGDIMLGQFIGGIADGYNVHLLSNKDLIISTFKNGDRKGIGLYLHNSGEWETILSENGDMNIISSSAEYKAADEARKRALKAAFSEALGYFSQAAAVGVNIANTTSNKTHGYSANEYTSESNTAANDNSDSIKKPGGKYDLSQQNAYNADKRTYAKYDSMLAAAFAGNRNATTSEISDWQSKMKSIRQKWENRGKSFPKSANETR